MLKYGLAALALISSPAYAGTYAETVKQTSVAKVKEAFCLTSAKVAAAAWDAQADGRSLPSGPTPYINGLANAGSNAYLTGMRRQNIAAHVYSLCISGKLDDVIARRY